MILDFPTQPRACQHMDEDLFPLVDRFGDTIGYEVRCLDCGEVRRYIAEGLF